LSFVDAEITLLVIEPLSLDASAAFKSRGDGEVQQILFEHSVASFTDEEIVSTEMMIPGAIAATFVSSGGIKDISHPSGTPILKVLYAVPGSKMPGARSLV
jgi:hypothetical protein